jgi:hypothetical protein
MNEGRKEGRSMQVIHAHPLADKIIRFCEKMTKKTKKQNNKKIKINRYNGNMKLWIRCMMIGWMDGK